MAAVTNVLALPPGNTFETALGKMLSLGKLPDLGLTWLYRFFSPANLFANGESGAWYDPSDLTTLYQDAAGTTPVTAVEQPVGLMLDKSKGLVLGPELVVNGDFSDGTTGWSQSNTLPSTATVIGGEFVVSSLVASGRQVSAISCVVGRTYKVTGLGRVSTGTGSAILGVSNDPAGLSERGSTVTTSTSATPLAFIFTASANTHYITAGNGSSGTGDKIFDNISVRELPGNHATQPTATSRPVVSARVNQLLKTEQLAEAPWSATGTVTRTANYGLSPIGTQSSTRIQLTSASSRVEQFGTVQIAAAYTGSVWLKAVSSTSIRLRVFGSGYVNLGTVTVAVNSAWTQFNVAATGAVLGMWIESVDGGADIEAWGADLRVANDGVGIPNYQRVNTATDYDSTGFPVYLRADGVDDGMVTNSIDFTSTDKMTVVAGVRKLSDAVAAPFAELSATNATNNGVFTLWAPPSGADRYGFVSKGTDSSIANSVGYASPITNIVTGFGNISGDSAILRVNAIQAAINTADQGTGNYGAYPLYLFRRGGTTLPFNGRFYGLTIVNKLLSTTELAQLETYTNSKTRAFA